MSSDLSHVAQQGPTLVGLVYELLHAHEDTARLAVGLEWHPYWSEHLDHLRELQRISRETLASAQVERG